MSDLISLITNAVPLSVTVFAAAIAVFVVVTLKVRGTTLQEHVSIANATVSQMDALIKLNKRLNEQIDELQNKVEQLTEKVEKLEEELKEARHA